MIRSLLLLALAADSATAGAIDRLWITHPVADASKVAVCWQTGTPQPSVVEFGATQDLGQRVEDETPVRLHQMELPLVEWPGARVFYRVRSGTDASETVSFKSCAGKELRVAVVGDWGYAPGRDLSALIRDDVHLLLTAGDNVPSLHVQGREGIQAFEAWIDSRPALFRSTVLMPVLGNHDRELTPRGAKPPDHAVYDVEARTYREFFALPGDEWKWHLDLAAFDLRIIALDLNHIQDFGTTWQTCHAWQADSPQFRWYRDTLAATSAGFVITVMNEKQTQLNGLTKGAWHAEMSKGSALVSGFGYFAERAELADGLPYFNTCLKGDGDVYKDPRSQYLARQDSYLLLTVQRDAREMTAQLKSLRGEVLDTRVIPRRPRR